MKRDSFIFYRSFFEAITELPDKDRLLLFSAISEYSLNFKKIELSGISKTIFILIKPQLDANNKRFINGCKPKTKAKDKQTGSKDEANNNVNDNVNVNEEKKEVFNFKKSLLELGIEKQIVDDWLKVRTKKKASNTETAFKKIKSELEKSNISANESIKIAAEKSWTGFEAKWINNLSNGTHKQNNQKEFDNGRFKDIHGNPL